jgi:hypothetical protein
MSRAPSAAGDALGRFEPTGGGYLAVSARPLTSLVFVLPFILLYEVGTRVLLTNSIGNTQHIVAFTLLRRFLALFGATGQFLPALAVVSILIAWHLARRDGWSVSLPALLGMAVESIALAFPLIVFALMLARLMPLAAPTGSKLPQILVLSLGAGIYEEAVFRLMLCTGLAIAFKNGLKLSPRTSLLLLVVISATTFSAYHYLGNEAFHWRIFVFRLSAGAYFAGLFLARGFGITAGVHMAYDVIVALR